MPGDLFKEFNAKKEKEKKSKILLTRKRSRNDSLSQPWLRKAIVAFTAMERIIMENTNIIDYRTC